MGLEHISKLSSCFGSSRAALSTWEKSPFPLFTPLSSSSSGLFPHLAEAAFLPLPPDLPVSNCGPHPLNVDHTESHLSSLAYRTMVRSNSSPQTMACFTLSAEWALRFSDDTQEKATQEVAPSTFPIYSSPCSGKAIVQSCSLKINTKRRLVR